MSESAEHPASLTLGELLASRPADGIAFYDQDQPVTYGDWHVKTRRIAALLSQQGIRAGDRVAVWLPNQRAFVDVLFACAQLGIITVAVNTRFKSHEVQDIVRRSGARVLIADFSFGRADFARVLAKCDPAALAAVEYIIDCNAFDSKPRSNQDPIDTLLGGLIKTSDTSIVSLSDADYLAPLNTSCATPGTPCLIFTTSGTTSAPKFVLHTQQSLTCHGKTVSESLDLDSNARVLVAPPLCGVFGLVHVCAALYGACPWIMFPVWDATVMADAIDRYRVTHFNATDDAINQLLVQRHETPIFPSVRFAGTAAFNPTLADIAERAEQRGLTLVGLYGASEVQALLARGVETDALPDRARAGGQLLAADARVRVRHPDTGALCDLSEPGELELFSPQSRMQGYFANSEASNAAFTSDGWYRTGDLGYRLSDTRFVYLERLGDAMRLGGFLTSPLEIETLIQAEPEVDGCQVVAVNTSRGQRAFAFITSAQPHQVDTHTLRDRIGEKLASYKTPVGIMQLESFPVTEGTNAVKIQKGKLREMAQEWVDQ